MIPLDVNDELFGIAYWMGVARSHDPALYTHSIAVAEWTAQFATCLGYPPADRERLTKAAFLHDIGKIKIPPSILRKPGPLTPKESLIMRSHCDSGCELLRQAGDTDEFLLAVVRDHHERLDGTGYPRGLLTDAISVPTRIVTLCDVFSAITERRTYAEPLAWDAALNVMFAKQTRLDLELLTRFATMMATLQEPRKRWSHFLTLPRRKRK